MEESSDSRIKNKKNLGKVWQKAVQRWKKKEQVAGEADVPGVKALDASDAWAGTFEAGDTRAGTLEPSGIGGLGPATMVILIALPHLDHPGQPESARLDFAWVGLCSFSCRQTEPLV